MKGIDDPTFNRFGDRPKVGATVDVPFCVAGGLGRKRGIPVVPVMLGMDMRALLVDMGVGMAFLLGAQEAVETRPRLAEEVHENEQKRGARAWLPLSDCKDAVGKRRTEPGELQSCLKKATRKSERKEKS